MAHDHNGDRLYERYCLDSDEGLFQFSFDFLQPRIMVDADDAVNPAPLIYDQGTPAFDYAVIGEEDAYRDSLDYALVN